MVASNLAGDRLNVRAGPGLIYVIIDTMIEGEAALITSDTASAEGYRWWPVELVGSRYGWVAEGSIDGSELWLVPLDGSFPNPLRSLARSVQHSVADRDTAFFWNASNRTLVSCPGGGDVYACKGHPDGSYIEALGVTNPFEGTLYNGQQYLDLLERWFAAANPDASDAYGDGSPEIYAIAMSTDPAGVDEYHIIVSAILSYSSSDVPRREVLVFNWRLQDGEWRHSNLYVSEGFWEEGGVPPISWMSGDCRGQGQCLYFERWDGDLSSTFRLDLRLPGRRG